MGLLTSVWMGVRWHAHHVVEKMTSEVTEYILYSVKY